MARFKKPSPFATPSRIPPFSTVLPSPCVTGGKGWEAVAALRNGGIGDGSGSGPVGGLYITDGASECQGQAVHFFACTCVRACMRVQAICTLAGFSKYS